MGEQHSERTGKASESSAGSAGHCQRIHKQAVTLSTLMHTTWVSDPSTRQATVPAKQTAVQPNKLIEKIIW